MSDDNGRIKLTWPQVTWGITVLALVLGAWFDLRGQVQAVTMRLLALESRSQITAFTKEDADELRRNITEEIRTENRTRRTR